MEIYDKSNKGFIEVWMTKGEQESYNRKKIAQRLLMKDSNKKCKVVFLLSGNSDIYLCTKQLLLLNCRKLM